jgi:hypothetical protein
MIAPVLKDARNPSSTVLSGEAATGVIPLPTHRLRPAVARRLGLCNDPTPQNLTEVNRWRPDFIAARLEFDVATGPTTNPGGAMDRLITAFVLLMLLVGPSAAGGLGDAAELEHARANARAGGPISERDAELLERYGCLSGTNSSFCRRLENGQASKTYPKRSKKK